MDAALYVRHGCLTLLRYSLALRGKKAENRPLSKAHTPKSMSMMVSQQ